MRPLHALRRGRAGADHLRPVLDHVSTQVERGNLVLVEVDAYYLPDTRGVSYGQNTPDHRRGRGGRSQRAPPRLLPPRRVLHARGRRLRRAVRRDGAAATPSTPGCAAHVSRTAAARHPRARVLGPTLRAHLGKPVRALPSAFARDLAELAQAPPRRFTSMLRDGAPFRCGLRADRSFLSWLGEHGDPQPKRRACPPSRSRASRRRSVQGSARGMRKRAAEFDGSSRLAVGLDAVYQPLREAHG